MLSVAFLGRGRSRLAVVVDPTVVTVTTVPTTLSGSAGDTLTLFAIAKNAAGMTLGGKTFTVVSSDTGVATVSVLGSTVTVTFVADGDCTITVTCETVSATAVAVTVSGPGAVTSLVAVVHLDGSITLTWVDNVGATDYTIVEDGVTVGTAAQGDQTFTIPAPGAGAAVTSLAAVVNVDTSIDLTWVDDPGATDYTIKEDGVTVGTAAQGDQTFTIAAVPASIALTPVAATIHPADTTQLTAAFFTDIGRAITGLTPTSWEIDDVVNFSIDSSGLVTAITDGDVTAARAHYDVGSIHLTSNDCTVTCSALSGGPNEPAGLTMLLTHDGSAVQPNAAWDYARAGGQQSVVMDPERGSVLQIEMTPETTPGAATAELAAGAGIIPFAPTKFYLSWYEKLSPGFVGNDGAGGGKDIWMIFQSQYVDDRWLIAWDNLVSDVTSHIRSHFDLYNVLAFNGNTFGSPASGVAILPAEGDTGDPGDIRPRGTWVFIEVVVTLNARGAQDGEVQMWIDGVDYPITAAPHTYQVSGLHVGGLQLATDVGPRLAAIDITNVWGGGGNAQACDNYNRYANIYLSAGYARAGEEPNHWVLALASGETSTPAAGSSVELVAQLVDGNGNSVDVFGPLLLPTLHVTGSATVTRHADPGGAPYALENSGTVLIRVDVDGGATSSSDIAVSLDDYAKINNAATNGTHRLSNTLHLTVS